MHWSGPEHAPEDLDFRGIIGGPTNANYGKIKKDSNFQNDIVNSFFRAAS